MPLNVWVSVRMFMCSGCPNVHFEEGCTYEVREYYHTGRDASFRRRKTKERTKDSAAFSQNRTGFLEFCRPLDPRPDRVFLYPHSLELRTQFLHCPRNCHA